MELSLFQAGVPFHLQLLLKPAPTSAALPCSSQGCHSYTWPFSTAPCGDYVERVRAVTLAVLSWGPLISLNVQVGQGRQAAVPVFTRGEVELVWGDGDSEPCLLWLPWMLKLPSSVLGDGRSGGNSGGTWWAWAAYRIYSGLQGSMISYIHLRPISRIQVHRRYWH